MNEIDELKKEKESFKSKLENIKHEIDNLHITLNVLQNYVNDTKVINKINDIISDKTDDMQCFEKVIKVIDNRLFYIQSNCEHVFILAETGGYKDMYKCEKCGYIEYV